MATMAARPIFIDTNVLIYANVASAPMHSQALTTLNNLWTSGEVLWISRQVIREYVANVTRPQTYAAPMPATNVIARVQYFEQTFQVAEDTSTVTGKLRDLLKSIVIGGKQMHDANIVASMLSHGIDNLLTHNVTDFNRYNHLITVIPL